MDNEDAKKYYRENREKILKQQQESVKRRTVRYKNSIWRMLGNTCNRCGYSDDPTALFLRGVERNCAYITWYRRVQHEISRGSREYYLLCANCDKIMREYNRDVL